MRTVTKKQYRFNINGNLDRIEMQPKQNNLISKKNLIVMTSILFRENDSRHDNLKCNLGSNIEGVSVIFLF